MTRLVAALKELVEGLYLAPMHLRWLIAVMAPGDTVKGLRTRSSIGRFPVSSWPMKTLDQPADPTVCFTNRSPYQEIVKFHATHHHLAGFGPNHE